jgi:hypothetical protein
LEAFGFEKMPKYCARLEQRKSLGIALLDKGPQLSVALSSRSFALGEHTLSSTRSQHQSNKADVNASIDQAELRDS